MFYHLLGRSGEELDQMKEAKRSSCRWAIIHIHHVIHVNYEMNGNEDTVYVKLFSIIRINPLQTPDLPS